MITTKRKDALEDALARARVALIRACIPVPKEILNEDDIVNLQSQLYIAGLNLKRAMDITCGKRRETVDAHMKYLGLKVEADDGSDDERK